MQTQRIGRDLSGWIERQLRLALPGYCAFCLGEVSFGQAWCGTCFASLPWNGQACQCCGDPLSFAKAMPCRDCVDSPPAFTRAHVPFLYQGQVRQLIREFKFHASPRAGVLLMALFKETLAQCPAEALIPVPLHQKRSQERGFNQAQWLVKELRKTWDIPIIKALRTVDTPSQRLFGRTARQRNLEGVFAITARLPKHVVIMDDVLTTGATAHALALVAKEAGAEKVDVYALARTPRR
ncbi:ComF family protein [Halomonas vilamensis]|uniref:ComF family protein n=1 Tax=Vreelandella vilamensis TaxID=531309 RepID=A0ABU1H2D6_9GAMM|nr:ComF family protein [Halomonas vilamensis]MDR5898404.1 ComF family protein [Halomonas vilamensis]